MVRETYMKAKASNVHELHVAAELSSLDKVRGFLEKTMEGLSLSEEERLRIALSLHEICVNIIRYAYPGAKGGISLKIWQNRHKVFLEIRDKGIPFDPRKKATPDPRKKIKAGEKSGWGIFLSRSLMDEYAYRRAGGENILTIAKKI
ncbi:MAG: ATP-binding protein [Acidobacteriota bacterium]|nr:ATP-binding protein [Acidobacteriota bacterium]